MKTRSIAFACLLLLGTAVSAAGQAVEYVTRNVQPTHAIRFNAQPLRVTLTDRGARNLPLRSSQIDGRPRPKIFIGGGRRIVIGQPVIVVESPAIRTDPRPRTVYGANRPDRVAQRAAQQSSKDSEDVQVREPSGDTADSEAAERRRMALHARAILRAERRAADRSRR